MLLTVLAWFPWAIEAQGNENPYQGQITNVSICV